MSLVDLGQMSFESQALRKLILQVEKVLRANTDILVFGASGTGKTSWAKKLAHRKSSLQYRVFEGRDFDFADFFQCIKNENIDIAIVEDVEQLSFSCQSQMLAWLENPGRKQKVIFTTRVQLMDAVAKQNFRSDLYFKISVASLRLPELREMKEDLPALVHHLAGVFQILHNRSEVVFSAEAVEKLSVWPWPGNFSELENVLEKTILLTPANVIEAADIETQEGTPFLAAAIPIKKLAEVERDLILQTLKVTAQNRTRAAEILGISIRTLRNKIQEYRAEGIL